MSDNLLKESKEHFENNFQNEITTIEKSKHPDAKQIKNITGAFFSLVVAHKSLASARVDYQDAYLNYKNNPDDDVSRWSR